MTLKVRVMVQFMSRSRRVSLVLVRWRMILEWVIVFLVVRLNRFRTNLRLIIRLCCGRRMIYVARRLR